MTILQSIHRMWVAKYKSRCANNRRRQLSVGVMLDYVHKTVRSMEHHISLPPVNHPGRWANMCSSLRYSLDTLTACIRFWLCWVLSGVLCGLQGKVDYNHSRWCLYNVRTWSACRPNNASWSVLFWMCTRTAYSSGNVSWEGAWWWWS